MTAASLPGCSRVLSLVSSTDSAARAATAEASPVSAGTEKALVRLGDITCTQTAVITPLGRHPVSGLIWSVEDHASVATSRRLPGRLAGRAPALHRRGVTGELHVIVESGSWQHRCVIPVTSLAQITDIYTQVLLARSLTGSIPSAGMAGGAGMASAPPQKPAGG